MASRAGNRAVLKVNLKVSEESNGERAIDREEDQYRWNVTSIVCRTGAGFPFGPAAGRNLQVRTASIAFSSSPSPRPFTTLMSVAFPSGVITATSNTVPWYFAFTASSEYCACGQ